MRATRYVAFMRRVVVSVVVAGVVVVRDRNRIDRNNYLRQENWGGKGGKKGQKRLKKSVVAGQSGCLMLNSKRARAQGATVRGEDEKRWLELNVLSE